MNFNHVSFIHNRCIYIYFFRGRTVMYVQFTLNQSKVLASNIPIAIAIRSYCHRSAVFFCFMIHYILNYGKQIFNNVYITLIFIFKMLLFKRFVQFKLKKIFARLRIKTKSKSVLLARFPKRSLNFKGICKRDITRIIVSFYVCFGNDPYIANDAF